MTADTSIHRPGARTMSSPRVAWTIVRAQHWLLWTALAVAVAATALALVLRLRFDIETSVWEYVGTPARWILFIAGVMVTPAVLPVYVAHGVTRRTFATAVTMTAVLLAVVTAAYMLAGLLTERVVFAATGAGGPVLSNPHLFDSTTQVPLVLVGYGLGFLGYLLSGWLVGSTYYRHGRLRGTLLLPLTLLPLVVMDVLLDRVRLAPGDPPAVLGLEVPVAAGLSLVVIAAAVVAVRVTVRDIPIRPC